MFRTKSCRFPRPAFSLIELLVVIAVIALLISILLPGLCFSRAAGRKGVCQSNLKQFGVGIQGYATDFHDRLVSVTWRKQVRYVDWTTPNPAPNVTKACADQAIDIIRRRTGRTDIQTPVNWIPFPLYNHLVMNDYLAQKLPEPMVVCPEDRLRILWQRSIQPDPLAFHALAADQLRPGTAGVNNDDKRWPFSSTYQFVACFWSPDNDKNMTSAAPLRTVNQVNLAHNFYNVPAPTDGTTLGDRRMTEVEFPSNKVAMFDQHARHPSCNNKNQLFHLYDEATVPLLFFDTSVRDVKTANSNKGFDPRFPTNHTAVTNTTYTPSGWEQTFAPIKAGVPAARPARYRFTRAGLRGVDVTGTEIRVLNPN
ncbi:MAG: type II secretion system protein [Deltaproteobacteria bacterium]|nr:type II secretion system protein [Deltaproteobacteria bacterium]